MVLAETDAVQCNTAQYVVCGCVLYGCMLHDRKSSSAKYSSAYSIPQRERLYMHKATGDSTIIQDEA